MIVQYKYGIRFDQNHHIKNDFYIWLSKLTDTIGACDTSFQTKNTYENEIAEDLTIPPKDHPSIENKYCGLRFNDNMRK